MQKTDDLDTESAMENAMRSATSTLPQRARTPPSSATMSSIPTRIVRRVHRSLSNASGCRLVLTAYSSKTRSTDPALLPDGTQELWQLLVCT